MTSAAARPAAAAPDLDGLLRAWSGWSGSPSRIGEAWRIPSGPIPLALDEALWTPSPSALAAAHERGDDVLLPPGAASEASAREAGYRPWLAVRADDPFAASAPRATARVDVADAAPRRWDAAHSVAQVLLAAASSATPTEAHGEAATLAAALAAAAEEDGGVALHLSGTHDADRAAAVSVRTPHAFVVVASGGADAPLAARLLDDARAIGLRGFWTRTCPLDDPAAWLRRWTPDA